MCLFGEYEIDWIVKWIIQNIEQGLFNAGERLPSERDLAHKLDASRATIQYSYDIYSIH